jgi:hypothetical protein
MYGLHFKLPPQSAEQHHVVGRIVHDLLHNHVLMEVLEKGFHVTYCSLLFVEGHSHGGWYVWSALPLAIVSAVSIVSLRGE